MNLSGMYRNGYASGNFDPEPHAAPDPAQIVVLARCELCGVGFTKPSLSKRRDCFPCIARAEVRIAAEKADADRFAVRSIQLSAVTSEGIRAAARRKFEALFDAPGTLQ